MPFLHDAWYVACWAKDLGATPLARTLLDRPVVLYRTAEARAVALEDRCCHRALPLSMGRIEGDGLRCGYHGLLFNAEGICVEIPGQSAIPPGAAVRAYPVVERWAAIWIWTGEPALADPAAIPDAFWLDSPGWTAAPGYLRAEADYRLLVDNLLDLTHVSYLHLDTLSGSQDVEAIVPATTRRRGDRVLVGRMLEDVLVPPLYSRASGITGRVDRWQWITWQAPANVFFDVGCAPTGTGAPDGDRGQGVSMWSTHLITPETETTTHYHFSWARDFRLGDRAVTDALREDAREAFKEDLVALEAQQRAIAASSGAPALDINIDNGALQYRRILDRKIAAEAARPAGGQVRP